MRKFDKKQKKTSFLFVISPFYTNFAVEKKYINNKKRKTKYDSFFQNSIQECDSDRD